MMYVINNNYCFGIFKTQAAKLIYTITINRYNFIISNYGKCNQHSLNKTVSILRA